MFRELRKRAGLEQSDVAKCINVTQGAVSMWECGKNFPQAELLPKIAALYGCTVDELLANGQPQEEAS